MSAFPINGHSPYGGQSLTKMPQNIGTKLGFDPVECVYIQHWLIREACWRNLAMIMTGVDTHLRSIDLCRLGYDDVMDVHGRIRRSIVQGQQKNKRTVECILSEPTRQALGYWIKVSGKSSGDYLFTSLAQRRDKPHNTPVSRKTLARTVKQCAEAIGLDPTRYSTKSLRISRIPAILNAVDNDYAIVQDILGHADIRSTALYCQKAMNRALEVSRSIQFFEPLNLPNPQEV